MKTSTIAKPYANAVFETALEAKQLDVWEAFLQQSVVVINDQYMQHLLKDPRVSVSVVLDCFFDLLGKLSEQQKNFLKLLAEYERLFSLSEILTEFLKLVAEYEKTTDVQVTAAMELSTADKQKLIDALEKKLKRKVELHCDINQALLAGAVIRIGDSVIDGSMKGQLQRMKEGLIA